MPSSAAALLLVTATGATLGAGTRPDASHAPDRSRTAAQLLPEHSAALVTGRADDERVRSSRDRGREGPRVALREQDRQRRALARAGREVAERRRERERQERAERRERRERAAAHRWVLPAEGRLTSGFGYRWGRLHAGVDVAVPAGTAVHAMSSGTVTRAGWDAGGGLVVAVRQWDGTVIRFLHLSQEVVSVGQAVEPGQLVGRSGSTGHSTGPHLHLEVLPGGGDPVDPLPWLAEHHLRF